MCPLDQISESTPSEVVLSDSAMSDSVLSESAVPDSLREWGLVFSTSEPSEVADNRERPGEESLSFTSSSWVLCPLLILFVIIAIRYRSNTRYVHALLQDMSSVRERSNVFDDTVRETSFLVLLNLLWIGSAGVLLCSGVGGEGALEMGLCAGVVCIYTLLMMAGYYIFGQIFTDSRHAVMWTRGFSAGQGVGSLLLFPLALLDICYSQLSEIWVISGLIVLIIVKIVFIWQGFRIFFSQCDSLLLFLYYLCSQEIVPLLLTYVSAAYLCTHLL